MKQLFLKDTGNGSCCLYESDSNSDEFVKIACALKGWFCSQKNHVVLSDGENETLFIARENKVMQVFLPRGSQLFFVGSIGVWVRDGLAYILNEDDEEECIGVWKSVLTPIGGPPFHYFLLQSGDKVELRYFVKEELRCVGKYQKVFDDHSMHLMAQREDGYYDVYTFGNFLPKQDVCGFNHFDCPQGYLRWNSKGKGWILHEGLKGFGSNAAVLKRGKYGEWIELYGFFDEEIKLVASGKWNWHGIDESICIEGVIYYFDSCTCTIDFDNPRPTLRKRIKRLIKNE